MRTFLLSAVLTVILSLPALAAPPSVVLVQIHSRNNTLTLTRGPQNTRTIALGTQEAIKNFEPNAEKLLVLFTELYTDGYELKNSTVSNISAGGFDETVTYVFVKP
ncbi:hypothetical protein [Hymenobacter negativus]|uniref:Uncharacterized protein n=1 Tax=Hymenobacter negativus TaxID=2795026 RepID=A0ABS3QG53_9BACT|nr:hypothetical protein [Hymenobacter negativus]MBO2010230.1 hypothetical protein [Hymenobacter negativus]